jgi:uncharacterized protein YegL
MSPYNRRLPVYLLLDCSESMAGDAFPAMTRGLSTMVTELRNDPMALETAALSLISFAGTARQLVPLTDILKFDQHHIPKLKLGSGTALGSALTLWEQCMAREVVKNSAEQKGDFKPVCFVLTDGEPTDAWEKAADRIRTTVCGKQANVIGVACGPDADLDKLRRITEIVVVMNNADTTSFAKFFKWVSASVSTASQTLERAGERGVSLPGLPADCLEVAGGEASRPKPVANRYFFLHARCTRNAGFYLLRFAQQEKKGFFGFGKATYKGVAAHALDDFDFDSTAGEKGPQVSSDALQEPAPCPYCQSPILAACQNGHFHCAPVLSGPVTLTCPWCQVVGQYGYATFGVGGGAG